MLHYAASQGRLELVDWLLENIFMENPSCKNALGETPLHLAAGYYSKGKIAHLLTRYFKISEFQSTLKSNKLAFYFI